jgi:hypothetical protein
MRAKARLCSKELKCKDNLPHAGAGASLPASIPCRFAANVAASHRHDFTAH